MKTNETAQIFHIADSGLDKRESRRHILTKGTLSETGAGLVVSHPQSMCRLALLCDVPKTSVYIATKLLKLWVYTTESVQLKHTLLFVNLKFHLFHLNNI
jgi:hypothetical protein